MKQRPRCTEDELKVLESLTTYMRTSVWTGPGYPVEAYLYRWQQTAETVADYPDGIDDFIYWLTSRDALEFILEKGPQPAVDVLRRLVEEADETFRAATRDDGGQALSRFWKPAGTTWWYSRRPFTGPLSTYLDTGKYGA
ncbi:MULTISPECIES: hypothetical protein [unclassified Corallococcus]|uniref:hypothetical protein n=2 Tax=Myxococcaceae TaxID=31 RepID=UPI001CC069AE|nr:MULTISPECIES: hypothetical protein [unclassified Corallococcus]MBZ4335540.1 hypothetical protein [Corallococcus sp. AS-1-12]MBZ4372842.1 hypothetical protein [Corallococcus sp. AS-1-6]